MSVMVIQHKENNHECITIFTRLYTSIITMVYLLYRYPIINSGVVNSMEDILGNELDHWSKLQGKIIKKKPLEKRLSDLKKVILDPDKYNTNLCSRERMDEMNNKVIELEKRLERIERLLNDNE